MTTILQTQIVITFVDTFKDGALALQSKEIQFSSKRAAGDAVIAQMEVGWFPTRYRECLVYVDQL